MKMVMQHYIQCLQKSSQERREILDMLEDKGLKHNIVDYTAEEDGFFLKEQEAYFLIER
jgi:hypothetical protein